MQVVEEDDCISLNVSRSESEAAINRAHQMN